MEKRITMIYSCKSLSSSGFDWLKSEARKEGVLLDILTREELTVRVTDGMPRFYHRGTEHDLSETVVMRLYDFALSSALENIGIRVVNTTRSMILSLDKGATHTVLSSAGVPMPRSMWGLCDMSFEKAASLFGVPFVAKSAVGSKGSEVWLVSDAEMFEKVKKICTSGIVVQEFIEEAAGRDVRIWVTGGKVSAAVERRSEHDFRSNYSLGGSAYPYIPNDEEVRLALKTAETLGLEICGIDLLRSKRGPLVCEANGNAGFRSVTALGTANIPADMFRYLKTIV